MLPNLICNDQIKLAGPTIFALEWTFADVIFGIAKLLVSAKVEVFAPLTRYFSD